MDVATSAVRAICVDPYGRRLATGSAQLHAPAGANGRAEQDAASWWPAVRSALGEMTTMLGPRARRIRALSITATSGTIVPVDAAGTPLTAALTYRDARATRAAAVAQEAAAERWADLGISINSSSALAKLGWLEAEGLLAGASRICHVPDLIGRRLTGEPVPTDWSHALKSGFDPLRREWATEAMDALGIDAELLPEVLPPATLVGEVGRVAAGETGLPLGCELRLAMTDGCTAQLATGAAAPGDSVTVLGTTCVIKAVSRAIPLDPTGAVYSHLHPDGLWLPGGASNTGGEGLGRFQVDRLDRLAAAAAARGPATVIRYPLCREGERFPFLLPAARGFTVGRPIDEVDDFRATLEGIAFLERLAYERLESLGVGCGGTLVTAGGGRRSLPWLRIRATVLGRELWEAEQADSAFGACLLAAAGSVHADPSAAAHQMVRRAPAAAPESREEARLEQSFQRFRAALADRGWIEAGPRGAI